MQKTDGGGYRAILKIIISGHQIGNLAVDVLLDLLFDLRGLRALEQFVGVKLDQAKLKVALNHPEHVFLLEQGPCRIVGPTPTRVGHDDAAAGRRAYKKAMSLLPRIWKAGDSLSPVGRLKADPLFFRDARRGEMLRAAHPKVIVIAASALCQPGWIGHVVHAPCVTPVRDNRPEESLYFLAFAEIWAFCGKWWSRGLYNGRTWQSYFVPKGLIFWDNFNGDVPSYSHSFPQNPYEVW